MLRYGHSDARYRVDLQRTGFSLGTLFRNTRTLFARGFLESRFFVGWSWISNPLDAFLFSRGTGKVFVCPCWPSLPCRFLDGAWLPVNWEFSNGNCIFKGTDKYFRNETTGISFGLGWKDARQRRRDIIPFLGVSCCLEMIQINLDTRMVYIAFTLIFISRTYGRAFCHLAGRKLLYKRSFCEFRSKRYLVSFKINN